MSINTEIFAIVSALGEKYKFDAAPAYEFLKKKTELLKPFVTEEETASVTDSTTKKSGPEKAEHEMETWTKKAKKLEETLSSGKSKNEEKDKDALKKLNEKIEKQKEKLKKIQPKETITVEPEEKPKKAAKTKKEEPVKVETKKEEEPKKDEKEKRIKRMTQTISNNLKTALTKVDLEITDKLKKEFVSYVDDLTNDDFVGKNLEEHMNEFANLKASRTASSNAAAGGSSNTKPPMVEHLSITELRDIESLTPVEPKGTFWDAGNGRFVRGPEEVPDEDFIEKKFNTKNYAIGEKSGRVYEENHEGDVFVGFIGVGEFKNLEID